MEFDWKYALSKFLVMVTSRKFLMLLFAVLAVYGLDIPDELKAMIYFMAASVFGATQAYEDANGSASIEIIEDLPHKDS